MTTTTSVPSELIDPRSIAIDPEFQKRIPPISAEEKALLTESLEREGCRDPLIVAKLPGPNGEKARPVLLDGHNRKAICEDLGRAVHFVVLESITTREEALAWIDANQLGRRNLSDNALRVIRGRLYNREKVGAGERPDAVAEGGHGDHQKTAERIGDRLGVSEKTIRRDGNLAIAVEKLTKELPGSQAVMLSASGPKPIVIREAARIIDHHPAEAQRLLEGSATVSEVRREIQGEEPKADADLATRLGKRYDVVVVDAPWRAKRRGRPKKPSPGEVAPMDEAELSQLRLPLLDNGHVLFWTPLEHLPAALAVIDAWKLEYRCAFTWQKPEPDKPGVQPSVNSELVLYARRGKPTFVEGATLETAFSADNLHGRQKPDEFYAMIAGATEGERLLMFAELGVEGFEHWAGVEVEVEAEAGECSEDEAIEVVGDGEDSDQAADADAADAELPVEDSPHGAQPSLFRDPGPGAEATAAHGE